MSVAIVVPDGVGIKNYLYGSIIDKLSVNNKILIWHSLSQGAVDEIKRIKDFSNVEFENLPKYSEPIFESFLRETICLSRLIHNSKLVNNPTIITNWLPKKKGKKYLYFSLIEILAKNFFSKKYQRILSLESKYKKLREKRNYSVYSKVLKNYNVQKVFCTHQRAIAAIPAIESAKQNKIETFGAIFSWDNIPKARLTVLTDNYCVWSEHMKQELLQFYPEIEANKVIVTGTPQFEFYDNQDLYIPKEEFFAKHNLDISKKTICFSGDDKRTSPYDPEYLYDLANVISNLPEKEQPQIIFRRSPADFSNRYDYVFVKFPKIIKVIDPIWNRFSDNNWASFFPNFEDIKMLNNLAKHCDLVVNVGSTMALDFSKCNKPALYINYDVEQAKHWSVKTVYAFQHFRSMKSLKPVFWINSKEEYKDVLNKVLTLNSNDNTLKDIALWFKTLVNTDITSSTEITKLLSA